MSKENHPGFFSKETFNGSTAVDSAYRALLSGATASLISLVAGSDLYAWVPATGFFLESFRQYINNRKRLVQLEKRPDFSIPKIHWSEMSEDIRKQTRESIESAILQLYTVTEKELDNSIKEMIVISQGHPNESDELKKKLMSVNIDLAIPRMERTLNEATDKWLHDLPANERMPIHVRALLKARNYWREELVKKNIPPARADLAKKRVFAINEKIEELTKPRD